MNPTPCSPATVRCAHPADATAVSTFLQDLSIHSRHQRFHGTCSATSPSLLRLLCDVDGLRHQAWFAWAGEGAAKSVVGEVRFVKDSESNAAELAIVVADARQGSGLAGLLMQQLLQAAVAAGVDELYGDVMPDNERMLAFMQRHEFRAEPRLHEGVTRMRRSLAPSRSTADAAEPAPTVAASAAHGEDSSPPCREDARGCAVTGATPEALIEYERALAAFQAWRGGVDEPVARALQAAPGFVMAHVLQAWLPLLSRDPRRVQQARAPHARAMQLQAGTERERLHIAAIGAVLADDFPRAMSLLGEVLRGAPRDVLALQAAHSLDYLGGDLTQLADRVAQALPAWAGHALPGHHALLAMHAFGLVERGDYAAAERSALDALALNPGDARAHHVMAHVFESTGRAAEGVRWLERHGEVWRSSATVATHCTWHLALFHLELGDTARALALYDHGIPAERTGNLADLIDASALLWRMALRGIDPGHRWQALAEAWAPHIEDRYCSFSDVHAMLAFAGAHDAARSQRLMQVLDVARAQPTRHGVTTRQLGLPACEALLAYSRGEFTLAITLLACLPAAAHRLGGSHAQRDVLHLTLMQAVERIRRPAQRAAPGKALATGTQTLMQHGVMA